MTVKITQLKEKHLANAAELVCASYRALRKSLPILPTSYEREPVILEKLQDLYTGAEGVVALQDGQVVGFMMGIILNEFMGRRTAYSLEWANAARLEDRRMVYEEMYTRISRTWLVQGCYRHLVSLMASDPPGIETWYWLGFGLVNVDGVREIAPVANSPTSLEVRRAGVEETADLVELGLRLERHEYEAPTFWLHPSDDYTEWIKNSQNAAWLAYADKECVGFMAFEPGLECECELLRDKTTINISAAFTRPSARSRGIATALLNQGLSWAQSRGYTRCAVDFESMNTLATRFWTRWFKPVNYSLTRCLDERVK
jgi:GNAT superfamily N-acetyltransferase